MRQRVSWEGDILKFQRIIFEGIFAYYIYGVNLNNDNINDTKNRKL